MNYEKLGLKVGLEVHVQLDTKEKLFCHCPTNRSENLTVDIFRRLRPVASELGEMDAAALHEARKGIKFVYEADPSTNCLVEYDAEPPKPLNQEALDIALIICKMLNAVVVDELFVMRKAIIDGSIPSSFQRTGLLALGGNLGKVGIQTIAVEEDSAPPINANENEVHDKLDRLGSPLIEIATDPDIHTPEDVLTVAKELGGFFRATRRVKRGIGSIRQDINVSIIGGDRVEIKGAQDLKVFPLYVEREVQRQQKLIELKNELIKRKAKTMNPKIVDVSDLFKRTKCRFIEKGLKNNQKVLAMKLE